MTKALDMKREDTMKYSWICLSLMFSLAAYGESLRQEPSVFLEYEREIQKTAEAAPQELFAANLQHDHAQDPALAEKNKALAQNLKNAKEKVLVKAKELLGTPYGFGKQTENRTDCSGFTRQVFGQFGISLPRSAAEQAQLGENVDLSDLQVGDLLFYRTYKSDPSHVAIYAGDGQIIHASYSAKKVQFDSIDKSYYKNRFLYAKRLALVENDLNQSHSPRNLPTLKPKGASV